MRRPAVPLAFVTAAIALAGCGDGTTSGWTCSGGKARCVASSDGPATVDLAKPFGRGSELEFVAVEDDRATVASGGDEAELEVGQTAQVGSFTARLEQIDDGTAEVLLRRGR